MTAQTPTKPSSHPQTTWDGAQILTALVATLPDATSELQQQALGALKDGQYSQCKVYPCLALDDAFIKAIGYMSSIPSIVEKKVPTLPTLVAEGSRAIADAWEQHSLKADKPYSVEGVEKANSIRQATITKLEAINKEIFTKILGD